MVNRSLPYIAIALAVLPTTVIILNYLIAASEGYVPWCMPLWDSCTSISATGREGTAFYFFKATMIPMAALYWWYWRASNQVLNDLGDSGRWIAGLGLIASVALVCYCLALGAIGDNFRLTRRIGIILYFTFTYLCQLLIVYRFSKLKVSLPGNHWQQGLLSLTLLIGLLTLVWDAALPNYDDYEHAFEWNLALLVHLNFLLAAAGWWQLEPMLNSRDSRGLG